MALIDNLVAYWKLDENSGQRNDSHGNNHLADTGSTPSATGLVYPKAALFDGASGRALSCASTNLQFVDASFTVAGWIKPASFPTADPLDYHTLWTTGTNQWYGGFWVIINQAKQIAFGIFCKDNGANLYHSSGGWVTGLGIWYLVTTKYDKSAGKQWISVRSALAQNQSSGDWAYGPAACSADFYLGRNPVNQDWFDGAFGPVMVWDRCISNDEETTLYNNGAGWAYPTVHDAQLSLPAHYPNQRIINVPGFGVQASRRAVIAADPSNGLLTSLVAYWKMDEASGTRSDSHGANHLAASGTVGYAAGKIGNCASATWGTSNYLSCADNAALSTGAIDFTWSIWVNLSAVAGYRDIIRKWNAANGEYGFGITNLDKFQFLVNDGAEKAITIASVTATTGTWYHLVGWHVAAEKKIYAQCNGGTVHSVAYTGTISDSAVSLLIGKNAGTGYDHFRGTIDEIGFWKRVLSDVDRALLYNSGAGLAYSEFS